MAPIAPDRALQPIKNAPDITFAILATSQTVPAVLCKAVSRAPGHSPKHVLNIHPVIQNAAIFSMSAAMCVRCRPTADRAVLYSLHITEVDFCDRFDRMEKRHQEGFARVDERFAQVTSRMEAGFAHVNSLIETLANTRAREFAAINEHFTKIVTYNRSPVIELR
jgi:hypothetical protein